MEVRICPECGKHNPADAWHCAKCGQTLSVSTLAEVDAQPLGDEPRLTDTETSGSAPARRLSEEELDALAADLKAGSSAVRCSAARALGETRDPRALQPLVSVLRHYDRNTRIAAAKALGRLGDRRAVRPLADAIKYEHSDAFAAVKTALERLGASWAVAAEQSRRAKPEGIGHPERMVLIGGAVFALGVVVSLVSYNAAKPGGSYVVLTGAIVVGLRYFLKGLRAYIKME